MNYSAFAFYGKNCKIKGVEMKFTWYRVLLSQLITYTKLHLNKITSRSCFVTKTTKDSASGTVGFFKPTSTHIGHLRIKHILRTKTGGERCVNRNNYTGIYLF